MGFKIQGEKGPMAEINVTPFVDVMLVLLIIFMVTTPLMLNGIKLNLPKTKEVNQIVLKKEQIILSLTRTGEFFLGEKKVLKGELVEEILSLFKEAGGSQTIYIRADHAIKYGHVARLMSLLKINNISKIALVTETKNKK